MYESNDENKFQIIVSRGKYRATTLTSFYAIEQDEIGNILTIAKHRSLAYGLNIEKRIREENGTSYYHVLATINIDSNGALLFDDLDFRSVSHLKEASPQDIQDYLEVVELAKVALNNYIESTRYAEEYDVPVEDDKGGVC